MEQQPRWPHILLLLSFISERSTNCESRKLPQVATPVLPVRFYTEFNHVYTPREDEDLPIPPWIDGIPPQLPYSIGRGATWYASDLDIMIENFTDYCIPIFEPAAYFPCIFINYNHTAYLISPKEFGYGPCCVYRPQWHVPRRDFMSSFSQYYNGSTENMGSGVLNQTLDWWIIPQMNAKLGRLSDNAGFHPVFGGFGWARRPLPSGYQQYVSFWYEGDIGWAQQVFFNFTDTGPQTRVLESFKLPTICHTDLTCTYQPDP